jgi:hypothetical protein
MAILDKDKMTPGDQALDHHIRGVLSVKEPRGPFFRLTYPLIKRLFNPQLLDVESIPPEPCLFVGNHSLFAADGAILTPVMWQEQGRFLRGLGDRFLWNPLSEDFLWGQGGALGHPTVCSALMEAGENLMVFPGGAHEATKTQAERYTLQWRERYGFIRMAAQHNYPIVPMAIVGPDEFFDHAIEGRDIPDTRVWKWLERLGVVNDDTRRDLLPPVPLGVLGSPFPKPQYCYIQFGETVRPKGTRGRPPGKKKLAEYRAEVAGQIESMLDELLALRDEDRNQQGWLRSVLTR